jgi:hypothetical protein
MEPLILSLVCKFFFNNNIYHKNQFAKIYIWTLYAIYVYIKVKLTQTKSMCVQI